MLNTEKAMQILDRIETIVYMADQKNAFSNESGERKSRVAYVDVNFHGQPLKAEIKTYKNDNQQDVKEINLVNTDKQALIGFRKTDNQLSGFMITQGDTFEMTSAKTQALFHSENNSIGATLFAQLEQTLESQEKHFSNDALENVRT